MIVCMYVPLSTYVAQIVEQQIIFVGCKYHTIQKVQNSLDECNSNSILKGILTCLYDIHDFSVNVI